MKIYHLKKSKGEHLLLKANATAEPRTHTFPITANISFPTSIKNRGGETFNNNKSVSIVESSNLTLTVLPPYTTPELLTNFTETWILLLVEYGHLSQVLEP